IVSAILLLLERLASIQRLASRMAMITARQVLGYFLTKSAVVPSAFSGWSFQMSWVVAAVMPMLSMMARWFQGSPTQKPSMLPTRMLATICGGGTVMTLASAMGLMPWVASQWYSHIAWVPVGKVWAKVYSRFSVAISLARLAPSTAPLSASFLDRVMAWPLWLSVISTAMSFFGPETPRCTP